MPVTLEEARQIIGARLHTLEREINAFGSALPDHALKPMIHIIITGEEEYDCGWVFFYNSREYAIEGKRIHALAGNLPYIVTRKDGSIHETGRKPLSEYLDKLRERERG